MQKAFDTKLPKLKAATARLKILLLEQNSVAGSVSSDVATFLSQKNQPDWMPDEIWLLWTGALETEHYVHVAQLYPRLQAIKANWKNGKIS